MRITFSVILLLCLPLFGTSQNQAIQHFYNKYKSYENVTDVKLQGWLLKLAAQYVDDDPGAALLQKITHLRVLVMEEGNLVNAQEYKNLVKSVKNDRFEELFRMKEEGNDIEFLIREKDDTVTDVIILVNGVDGFVLLSLEGALKFSELNNLKIDIDGAEHFEKLPEKKKAVPRA